MIYNARNVHQHTLMWADGHPMVCLAPMVRAGSLPFRALSLKYGADYVFSEEIIDKRIIKATRRWNSALGTIDFVIEEENVILFRTTNEERQKLVFQLGTASGELALQAARVVENDVAGIDINMGCPKASKQLSSSKISHAAFVEVQSARRDGRLSAEQSRHRL
jgi:tRNA-dihydrouridine synthase